MKLTPSGVHVRSIWSVFGLLVLVACPGCLQRTISITTEPPGATVWLNDIEVGTTPLETDFTYYGAYDLRIRRAGYEAVLDQQKIDPPLQERPVIDLFAEIIPAKFENRVQWAYTLTPASEAQPPAGLGLTAADAATVERAKGLRSALRPMQEPNPPATSVPQTR